MCCNMKLKLAQSRVTGFCLAVDDWHLKSSDGIFLLCLFPAYNRKEISSQLMRK